MENHHVYEVNQQFLWPLSIAKCKRWRISRACATSVAWHIAGLQWAEENALGEVPRSASADPRTVPRRRTAVPWSCRGPVGSSLGFPWGFHGDFHGSMVGFTMGLYDIL